MYIPDLPERFGPMLVKELRQSLRRMSFVYPFLLIHVFAIVAIFCEFQFEMGKGSGVEVMFVWNPEQVGPFWWVALGVCGIFMPMAGFLLMTQEIEEGNHELLQLTTLTRWSVLRGKFFMLWGLCLLTFSSLLPYIILRYFLGGIEWVSEFAAALTVIAVAALMTAASIAGSAFRETAHRIAVFVLFWFSVLTGGGLAMIGGSMCWAMSQDSEWAWAGLWYHSLSALVVTAGFCMIGLLVARSQLRLALMNFEVKPTSMLVVTMGMAPFIIGAAAAFTCGFGSIIGMLVLVYVAWNADRTPKAPKWITPPTANIPQLVPEGN